MRCIKILLFIALTTAIPTSIAHTVDEDAIEQLTHDAELIFQGSLTNIEYRDSVEGIPHTFATYSVDEVLKGNYHQPFITLRFVGGYKERDDTGLRLIVSRAPKLYEGEEGIMLVKNNAQAESICPLAGCNNGRFMIESSNTISAFGGIIGTDISGNLTKISKSYAKDPHDGDYGTAPSIQRLNKAHKTPMSRDSFVAHLQRIISKKNSGIHGSTSHREEKHVISADPNIPFIGPRAFAEKPPTEDKKFTPQTNNRTIAAQRNSDFDQWEEEQLRLNGGNPVLSKHQHQGSTSAANSELAPQTLTRSYGQ